MHVSVCSTAVDTNVHASWHKFEGAVILHATRNPTVCHEGCQAQAHLPHHADAAGNDISRQRQTSNGRGPGLTQDLQGHGFVA